jgi:Phospholipid methyltransferase
LAGAREPLPYWTPMRVIGGVLLLAGAIALVGAFMRFVVEGVGTPAPVAAPERLVVGGVYRYVRNPMYVAVLAAIVGQALVLGRLVLLCCTPQCAGWSWRCSCASTRNLPSPDASVRTTRPYRRAVPAWWPRLRSWKPSERDEAGAGGCTCHNRDVSCSTSRR